MKYREFGNTGLKVSEIGFGAWAIGGNKFGNSYGPTDDKVSLAAIHKALEIGCNFFDTADVYGLGHSEELLGKVVRHNRDRMIIATKVGGDFYSKTRGQNFSEEYIRFALDKSLERLQTNYIDIYQLHNPPMKLIERPETYEVLKELKREGKIRAWGISIFDPVEGLTALRVTNPDCLQVVYNIFAPKPQEELFPYAKKSGCAIIAREPLANGFLTDKYTEGSEFEEGDIRHNWPRSYINARLLAAQFLKPALKDNISLAQFALKFALANDAVSVVIPGIKSVEQAQENLTSSDLGALTASQLALISELYKKSLG